MMTGGLISAVKYTDLSSQTLTGCVRQRSQEAGVPCCDIKDQLTTSTRRSIRFTATGYLKAESLWLNIHCSSTTSAHTLKPLWISGRPIFTFHWHKGSGGVPVARHQ